MRKERLRFLALSGSLRAASSNSALLQAAASLVPASVTMTLFEGLAGLPHFNPDLDIDAPPAAVVNFRARLSSADGVVICCPEYAHGVPGSFKNALDWVVSSGEFVGKPVFLLNTHLRSTFAQASLQETLTVMMAQIQEETCLSVVLASNAVTVEDILADASVCRELERALQVLTHAVKKREH